MTDYYPVSLNVAGRPCLVVGAGPVAARKVGSLLAAGALVTVIAPDISPEMADLDVTIFRRPYAASDIAGFRLVITATGDPAVDTAVFSDSEAAGVWVNSADDPTNCSFILPSVHRDGPVTISVSTAGVSPALATWLRGRLAAAAGPGVGELANLLGLARTRIHAEGISTETIDWAALLDGPLPGLLAAGQTEEAVRLIEAATGITGLSDFA
jgi:siroheme synthase-like protein